jgi:hypothetical protein
MLGFLCTKDLPVAFLLTFQGYLLFGAKILAHKLLFKMLVTLTQGAQLFEIRIM